MDRNLGDYLRNVSVRHHERPKDERDAVSEAVGELSSTTSIFLHLYKSQEARESFALADKINSISTEIPLKCSKLSFFSLESLEDSLYVWDVFSKGKLSFL